MTEQVIASDKSQIELQVFRYNPLQPGDEPRYQSYHVQQAVGMTLFTALTEVRENQDATLQFDFVCRAGICGSCAMLINGRPGLACRTLTQQVGPVVRLAPLPVFELIGDLSVNTGKWMRAMVERVEGWIHSSTPAPLEELEQPMEPALATEIYELERCIECGCCVAACGTAVMNDRFLGAVALNKVARFRLDPRDEREDADYYEVVADEDGSFGCMSLVACEDVCPRDLPLASQLAFLRRSMARAALSR